MKIIFLHGLESTPETSKTGNFLKSKIENLEIPEYNPATSDYDSIVNFFKTYFDENEDYIVIGTSIGGYWGLKLTEFTNVNKVILINPALKKGIEKYNSNLDVNPYVYGHMILNKDDKIVNNEENIKQYNDRFAITLFETGGHQCENIEEITKEIIDSLNLLSVWIP